MPSVRAAGLAALATVGLFASSVYASIDPIVVKGSKFFFKSNGTQFFIQGVAYQQDYNGNGTVSKNPSATYTDPLADAASCARDIPYLQQLRTNTIRTYAIDPTQNHDACMSALADAGIYVIADLSAPVTGQSINRNDPAWDDQLYARYTSVVDALAKYDNMLGFFAGNEVANMPNNTFASAFVKAAVRDTKAYIAAKSYRAIPVGYAANDDPAFVLDLAHYMDCGTESRATIDFFGYNIYSWCGDATYQSSNYEKHTQEYSSFNVPVFFSEYGCNQVRPRKWTEVAALFGPQMTPVWSGGLVYMYFQEANNYGLITLDGNSVETNDDFKYLAKAMSSIAPSGTSMSAYTPTNSVAACPTQYVNWTAAATPLPPTPNKDTCSCMYQSLSCVVSPNESPDNYGTLFGNVCGLAAGVCDGITANGSTGSYGPYGMCNATEKLAYAFDQYYKNQGSHDYACQFDGAAVIVSGQTPSGSCSSLLAQASSSAASGGAATSSKSSAANFVHRPSSEYGLLPAILVVAVGVISGVGMIAL